MFRFPRPTPAAAASAAAAAVALVAAGAAPARGQEAAAEVRDLTLPVLDLSLETSSLDRSYRRVETTEDVRLSLAADVLFRFDSAGLGPRARDRLADAAGEVTKLEPGSVRIVGHTDSRGSDAYNNGLSLRRARSVQAALEDELGAAAPSFEVSGKGESQPIAANTTADGDDSPKGRARNRRVEIRIPK